MHDKWFISDTHFFHANILGFKRSDGTPLRSFSSTEAMHEYIVSQWNNAVGANDYVYHLGDVAFGRYNDRKLRELLFSLRGRKRLILGNHDEKLLRKDSPIWDCFEKVFPVWKGFKEHDFTCTHIPHELGNLRDGSFNVHGHLHANRRQDPHYINVCVELRDYQPVHLDEIIEEIKAVG